MEQPDSINFLESNKDWLEFNQLVSRNTGNHYMKMWKDNAMANHETFKKHGWATEFQDSHEGQTVIMLGGSPSMKKQFDKLRGLQNDPDFVMVGISSGLKILLENGIKPKYVMIADADPAIARFWEGMDMEMTKDITLIANLCTAPNMIETWKGDIKFVGIFTDNDRLEKKIKKKYKPVNGIGHFFPALGSQYNIGSAMAYLVFGARVVIFVGNELSFPTRESTYYADRKDVKDSWERRPQVDIYGKTVYTNHMFMALKMMLEDFLGKLSGDGYFFNATESGIFGVSARFGNLPWIQQFTLPMAVAQARSIMRTGEPILDGFIQKPSMSEVFRYATQ